jgi:hypothetical protein
MIAKKILGAAALVLQLAGTASAALDGERFEKEAAKAGADLVHGRVRRLCICQDGGANHYHVGYLLKTTIGVQGGIHVTMTCQVPTLSTIDREIVSVQNCLTYEVLAR